MENNDNEGFTLERAQILLDVVTRQRDSAMNQIAQLNVEFNVLMKERDELLEKVAEAENVKKEEADDED
jgi:hypothetical protein